MAFYNCGTLTSMVISSSVEHIGASAFMWCNCLTNVTIESGVTSVGMDSFYGCSELTSVVIPGSVTSIGEYAFYNCNKLKSVYLPADLSVSIMTFPSKVQVFRYKASQVLSFDAGIGVSSPVAKIVSYGMPYGDLPSVVRHECVFLGWTWNGTLIDSSTLVTALDDHVLTAQWKTNQYTIIFNANGGTGGKSVTLDYGSALVAPTVTREGYTFTGWSPSVPATVPASDTTYTAQWRINQYMVVFDSSGGAGGKSGLQDYGSAIAAPTVTRTGYTFTGWSPEVDATVPARDVTYTAQWKINQYRVTFNANGGEGGTSALQDYGSAIVAPTVSCTEGVFKGWNPAVDVMVPDHDVTYVAQWDMNQYTVTFNANGGTGGKTVTQDYGSAIVPPTVTREGYTFNGWSPSVPTTVPAANATYTAQWKVNQYMMTFNANGGTGGTTKTQNYGTSLSAPTVTRTGYTFTGWSPAVPTTVPAANATYTAQWKINQYTVTFEGNGGALGERALPSVATTQDYGSAIVPPTVTREGYTFNGWSPAVPTTVPAANTTYTAQWKVNQYTVTFDENGGSGGATKTQDYESALVAPTVTRTGYTFTGWSPAVPSTVPANDATYTAQWKINQYNVVFDANGGIGGTSAKQDYGSAIVAPMVTMEWCTFAGWSPAVAATVPANNVTYTAQWARWGDSISASKMGGKTMRELYPSDYAHMTTVVLEEGITELPAGFFDGCDSVEFVTWPSTLVEFGIDDVPPKIRAMLEYDEYGFMIYNGWVLDYFYRDAMEVAIPEGTVGIGRGAFAEMYDLETVTMPESVKNIARGAFEGCTYIQDLQFMSGLRHVGQEAFRDCSSLRRAMFSDGVEYIGASAFKDCWQMQSVRLPYTVMYVGDNAFAGCGNIRGVTVPTQVETMQGLFPASYSKIETAEVAEGETAVMDDMFAGCVALRGGATQTDMSMIPNTVTNIGARAFQGCTALTAFVVPDSVVQIGVSVFQGCTALWNVTLSRSLSAIPDYAFYGCSMLETMIVPESVAYLGNCFFSGRTNPIQGQVIENALYYLCANAPDYHPDAYAAIAGNMTTYVVNGSRGWDGRQGSRVLPQLWNGYDITNWDPNRFDVTFDANGGQFDAMGGSTWSEQQITDTPYALPSTEPTRPGWAFEGWWTEQTGGAEVRYTTLVTATRTHTIYAHWRSLGNSMTVTFNSNGGTVVVPGTQDYVPGQTFGQFPTPTRRGYTFQGWWTEAVNGIRMTEATEVPAANMELFAHWLPITYYVRFHANGGTGTMSDQPFTYDVSAALKTHTFTRAGFAFTGWATTPGGQVRYAENKTVVNLEEVDGEIVDLYAVWSGVGYSVRFDSNGGTGIMDNQTIAVGETQNLWPCVFARGGYTFAGWAVSPTDAEAKKVTYLDGQAVKDLATSNGAVVPLYAVWVTGSQTVRITFDANGGSVAPNDYWDCVVGTAVEAFPTPTRPGFTFVGWFTAAIGGTQVSSIARVTSAQTFYAHWTENGSVVPGDDTCTVTFNANGGSVKETKRTVDSGAVVGGLPKPTRTGYVFSGWWTAAEGGVQVDASYVVGSSVTFYAHWISDAYIAIDTEESYETESDGSIELGLLEVVYSGSTPKLTVKGLPTGIKYDSKAMAISGKATKPGVYKVTVSATNATVKKPVTATFEIVVPNLASEVLPNLAQDKDAYGVVSCGVAIDPKLVNCKPKDGWTVKVAGLPAGLKFTAKDIMKKGSKTEVEIPANTIYGVPTKAGTFTVTFTATRGKEKQTATITLKTEALPDWAAGTFTGYVKENGGSTVFGPATMTVAASGKISGKFTMEGTNWTFSAASYAAVDGEGFLVDAVAKAGKATMPVEMRLYGSTSPETDGKPLVNASAEGGFGGSDDTYIYLWRNMWKDKATSAETKAVLAGWEGVYTLSMEDGGYASLTVGKNGDVKIAGKLADGTALSATSPFMYDICKDFFTVFTLLPSAYKGGFVYLPVGFGTERGRLDDLGGDLVWSSRNPQATGAHGEGFKRWTSFTGAYYDKTKKLSDYYETLRFATEEPILQFTFKETYLGDNNRKKTESYIATAHAVDTLSQPGLTATVNEKGAIVVAKATKPVQDKATKEWFYDGTNDGAMTLSFAQATGIFKGSYTFWYDYESACDYTTGKSTTAHVSKKVSFEGILVQGEEPKMNGFYLWDAASSYADPKNGKTKTYKYKESHPVTLTP